MARLACYAGGWLAYPHVGDDLNLSFSKAEYLVYLRWDLHVFEKKLRHERLTLHRSLRHVVSHPGFCLNAGGCAFVWFRPRRMRWPCLTVQFRRYTRTQTPDDSGPLAASFLKAEL